MSNQCQQHAAQQVREIQIKKAIIGVKVNRASDGFWYVDTRTGTGSSYKGDSRHATSDKALDRVAELVGWME